MKPIFHFIFVVTCLSICTNILHTQWNHIINPVVGQDTIIHKFEKDSLQTGTVEFHYGLFKPENSESGRKYPLIVALHGGEHYQATFDQFMDQFPFLLATVWAKPDIQKKYPCYIFAPHLTNNMIIVNGVSSGLAWEDSLTIVFLDKVLDSLIVQEQIDTNRIYITGHSLGGQGTYMVPALLKHKVAAIAPMSSAFAGDQLKITKQRIDEGVYKNIPIWSFHHRDDEFPSEFLREIYTMFEEKNYNPVCTKSFGTTMMNLPDSTIQNCIKSHQKYLYTEYYYPGIMPPYVPDTTVAPSDTSLDKWLFHHGRTLIMLWILHR